jgi:hypothetical protein
VIFRPCDLLSGLGTSDHRFSESLLPHERLQIRPLAFRRGSHLQQQYVDNSNPIFCLTYQTRSRNMKFIFKSNWPINQSCCSFQYGSTNIGSRFPTRYSSRLLWRASILQRR